MVTVEQTKEKLPKWPDKVIEEWLLYFANDIGWPPAEPLSVPIAGAAFYISSFPREVTETALAHVIGDKAEQAYRRSDALEKRRKLMEAWASYCEPKTTGNVVTLQRKHV